MSKEKKSHKENVKLNRYLLLGMPTLLVSSLFAFTLNPDIAFASNEDNVEFTHELQDMQKQLEDSKVKDEAKKILYQAPDATPLTDEGEEELNAHLVEKYMPIEGCSLIEDLPETSDINYVPPKPKPKPKPKPEPIVQENINISKDSDKNNSATTVQETVDSFSTSEEVEEKIDEKVENNQTESITNGSSISMSDEERFWLEKLVEAESANEPYEGKLAVATVIANRVELKEFPNTVNGVIRAPKQFSPFMDGSIEKRSPSGDAKRAVVEVFDKGNRILPKDTAFFYNADIVPGSWIGKSKQFVKKIGNHSFYLK